MHTLKPSLVPQPEYRRPFITYENRPDPDHEGKQIEVAIANVPLAGIGGQVAQLDAKDFDLLMEKGLSDQWWWHSNGMRHAYVRTGHLTSPGKMFTVARLIAGGQWGTRVRYRDGNALNLRRDNFKVREGYSKGREAAAMAETADGEVEF